MSELARLSERMARKILPLSVKQSLKHYLKSTLQEDHPNAIHLLYPIQEKARYGYNSPPHPRLLEIISRDREVYAAYLQHFLTYKEDFFQIPKGEWGQPALHQQQDEPFWLNRFLPGLDAISLYGLLCQYRPKRYFEIGSGNSTKFARKAIQKRSLPTQITSFDPHPRTEIDSLCDRLIRDGVENADLSVFSELEAGDILFVDCSHYVFMNSDVTVFFLEILPYLKPGVIVGIHDIFLPYDYPPQWVINHYSEQYLLAAYLLGGARQFRCIVPCAYISKDEGLRQIIVNDIWQAPEFNDGVEIVKPWINWLWDGTAFWLETR